MLRFSSLPDAQWTLAKSSNRIIESLWAGRFVVAHPIPSYMEFNKWAWIGGDLAEGIAWMVDNAASIAGRVSAAQDYIASAYSGGFFLPVANLRMYASSVTRASPLRPSRVCWTTATL